MSWPSAHWLMPNLVVSLSSPTNDRLEVNRWAHYFCQSMFNSARSPFQGACRLTAISRGRLSGGLDPVRPGCRPMKNVETILA